MISNSTNAKNEDHERFVRFRKKKKFYSPHTNDTFQSIKLESLHFVRASKYRTKSKQKFIFFFWRIRLVKQSKQKQTWRVLEWTKNSEFIYVDDEWSDRWPFGEIFFLVKISSFLLKCSCWFIDDDCFYDECTYSATFMKTFGLFTCCWSKLMVVITWTFLTKFLSILLWHPNETFIFYFVRNRLLSLQYS